MEDKNAEAILALLQGMEAKINKQEEVISSLLASKNETPTPKPKPVEADVVSQQRLLDEARQAELQQGNTMKAYMELDSYLKKNSADYDEYKKIIDTKHSYNEKLKELEKAVFVSSKGADEKALQEFNIYKGSFAEEGSGLNIKLKEIVESSNVETPSYFAQGGKSLSRENITSKIADFYKKAGNSNEALPKTITTEDLQIRGI